MAKSPEDPLEMAILGASDPLGQAHQPALGSVLAAHTTGRRPMATLESGMSSAQTMGNGPNPVQVNRERQERRSRHAPGPIAERALARASAAFRPAHPPADSRAGRAGNDAETTRRAGRFPAADPSWPLLARLAAAFEPVGPDESAGLGEESAALRHARGRLQRAPSQVGTALRSLPGLGPGDPLPRLARATLERALGRDLGGVRVHESTVVESFQAEAFASGLHLVFAPGRFRPDSPAGLALVAHELGHLGQPLGFKLTSGVPFDSGDRDEDHAREQEALVERIIARGWPDRPERAYRASGIATTGARPLAAARAQREQANTDSSLGSGARPRFIAGSLTRQDGDEAANLPAARLIETKSEPAPAGPDLDALARQVYALLKSQLRFERERHRVYDRPG